MELTPVPEMPGIAEAIVGEKAGEKVAVDLTLPDTFPVASLRGQRAQWVVHLLAGQSIEKLDDASPKLFERLKRGKNLDEVLAAIIKELIDEQANDLVLKAQNLVLDQLAARVKVNVTPAHVDREITTRWQRAEGDPMLAKGFSAEMIESAHQGWLRDASARADAERRLRISAVLNAIAERDQIQVTKEKLTEVLARHVPGVTPDKMQEALNETVGIATTLASVGSYLLTVEHVMSKAKVTYEGAKGK
jgi:trigger factor